MIDWRAERDTALLRLEREKDERVRAEAADAICDLALEASKEEAGEFSPAVVRLLADAQVEVRCAGLALASEVLSASEAKEILVRHLSDKAGRVRVEAAGRLADLALADTRGALAAMLEDELPEVRFEAARGMAALKHSSGFVVLAAALDSSELRFRAAGALAQLGNPEAIPHLRRVFRSWFLPAFDRTQLAGALARLGDAEGVAHLYKRTKKGWSMDRAMAVELLGEVKAPAAREALEGFLRNPKDSARGAAARALGRLGDLSAEPVLLAFLDDPALSDELRLDLAEGLLRLGSATGRAKLATLKLADPEAQAELTAMLTQNP